MSIGVLVGNSVSVRIGGIEMAFVGTISVPKPFRLPTTVTPLQWKCSQQRVDDTVIRQPTDTTTSIPNHNREGNWQFRVTGEDNTVLRQPTNTINQSINSEVRRRKSMSKCFTAMMVQCRGVSKWYNGEFNFLLDAMITAMPTILGMKVTTFYSLEFFPLTWFRTSVNLVSTTCGSHRVL